MKVLCSSEGRRGNYKKGQLFGDVIKVQKRGGPSYWVVFKDAGFDDAFDSDELEGG